MYERWGARECVCAFELGRVIRMTPLPPVLPAGVSCTGGEDDEPAALADCMRWAGAMPQRFRPCWVPCKDDCAFSAWSKFSECDGCGGLRSRKRSLTGE